MTRPSTRPQPGAARVVAYLPAGRTRTLMPRASRLTSGEAPPARERRRSTSTAKNGHGHQVPARAQGLVALLQGVADEHGYENLSPKAKLPSYSTRLDGLHYVRRRGATCS